MTGFAGKASNLKVIRGTIKVKEFAKTYPMAVTSFSKNPCVLLGREFDDDDLLSLMNSCKCTDKQVHIVTRLQAQRESEAAKKCSDNEMEQHASATPPELTHQASFLELVAQIGDQSDVPTS